MRVQAELGYPTHTHLLTQIIYTACVMMVGHRGCALTTNHCVGFLTCQTNRWQPQEGKVTYMWGGGSAIYTWPNTLPTTWLSIPMYGVGLTNAVSSFDLSII